MDTGERLAAYLSGDLDADERTAVEAELARDEGMRRQLDDIKAADEALAALPDIEMPRGVSERLHAAVAEELDRRLGDELAARRARRGPRLPGWLPAVGGAAAAVAALAIGVGVLTNGMGGGQDAATMDDSGARTLADAGEAAGAGEAAPEADDGQATGPVIVALGRTITHDDLASLAQADRFDPVLRQSLDEQSAMALADQNSALLFRGSETDGQGGAPEQEVFESPAQQDLSKTYGPAASVPLAAEEGVVSSSDAEAVAHCLYVLSEGSNAAVIPLYAELATDEEGRDVIVYVAVGPNAQDEYERVEVWMVDRETCELVQMVQRDR